MERFGGESLLSGQETLTRVTAQVEGWTDCAIQLFSRHNHDGATEHPNHAGMLHLTKVFVFFSRLAVCTFLLINLLSASPQSVVTIADFPSPFVPIFCILLRHFNHCYVLSHHINLLFGLPRFLFPGSSILSIRLPIYPSSFLRT